MLAARYRAVPFVRYHLDPQTDLVQILDDGRSLVLPKATVIAMQLCDTFQPLTEHLLRIRGALKTTSTSEDHVPIQVLAELDRQGLIAQESKFVEHIPPTAPDPATISSVFIITADRPASCGNALSSFIESSRRNGRQPRFLVMDDAKSLESRAGCMKQIDERAEQFGDSVAYCGRQEKELYVRNLERMGIDGDVARFALLGINDDDLVTIGANRNCALVESIDEVAFSVDDDLVCQVAPHPQRHAALRLCGHFDARDYWTFADRNEVIAQTHWEDVDVLKQHERLLGASLGNLVAEAGIANIDIQHACDHMLAGMLRGTSHVSVTVGGIAGDSGGRAAKWMLASSGQTMANLMASRAAYDMAFSSREVLGVAPQPSVTHKPFCQTANIGLDNRSLLPPFFPVGRGEDTVFGVLLVSAFPHCFLGHVPFALLHLAEGGRKYEQSFEYRISELLGHLIASSPCPAGMSRPMALRKIGRHLEEIARLSDEDFWAVVCDTVRDQTTFSMRVAQKGFSEEKFAACPDYWQQEMLNWHLQTVKQLQDFTSFVPDEYKSRYSLQLAKIKTQDMVAKAGKLLCTWPDLIEAARELKCREIHLCKPVRTCVAA